MPKMMVTNLSDVTLDYWVARAEGLKCKLEETISGPNNGKPACQVWVDPRGHINGYYAEYRPTSNWFHGGPIIERECITVIARGPNAWGAVVGHQGDHLDSNIDMYDWRGKTPLEAAMRAFVASKFGERVDE